MEEILNRQFSLPTISDDSDLGQILEEMLNTHEDQLGCPNNYTAIEGSSMLCVRVFSSAMFNETKSNSTVRGFTQHFELLCTTCLLVISTVISANSDKVTQSFDKARQLCQLGSTDEFSVDLLTVDNMADMKLTIHYLLEKGLLPNTELNYFWVGIHLVKVN